MTRGTRAVAGLVRLLDAHAHAPVAVDQAGRQASTRAVGLLLGRCVKNADICDQGRRQRIRGRRVLCQARSERRGQDDTQYGILSILSILSILRHRLAFRTIGFLTCAKDSIVRKPSLVIAAAIA
ncbi:MAG: hypothetical protein ACJA1L_003580 [Paracoccaceae bacterium]|jgi:hypothetical protein